MIFVSVNNIFNSFLSAFKSNCQFRERCQSPADNNITTLTLTVVLIKNIFVTVKYIFFRNNYLVSI